MDNLLEQGIAAYKAGKRDEARNFFIALTKQSLDDERAWEWMSKVTNNEQERNYCSQQIARINPKSAELNTPNTQQSSSTLLPSQNIKPVSLITLTCPSCGGKLQITNDIERFSCGHCGNEHVVRRSGNAISLAPIVHGLKEVKVGVDKTASELAIKRIPQEIEEIKKEIYLVQAQLNGRQFMEQQAREQRAIFPRLGYGTLIVFGIMFVGSASMIPSTDSGLAMCFGLFGVIMIIAGWYLFGNAAKGISTTSFTPEETEKLQKLQEILDKKTADLERHRSIVDS